MTYPPSRASPHNDALEGDGNLVESPYLEVVVPLYGLVCCSAPQERFNATLQAKKRKLMMAPEAVSQKPLTGVCPDLIEFSQ